MSTTINLDEIDLRWHRAIAAGASSSAAYAREHLPLGSYGPDVDPAEFKRIEALRDRIAEVGEDAAFDEWERAYMSAAVAEALPGHDDIDRVLAAAKQLWDALADLGVVDGYGGGECHRVLPAAIASIRAEANNAPWCPTCLKAIAR